MDHWAVPYIGEPWSQQRHCWEFFREIQQKHFRRDVPAVDVDVLDMRAVSREFTSNPERRRWLEVDVPREGDGVLMPRVKSPWHVGVWIDVDGGRVLHCDQHAGVLCQSLASLHLHGWHSLQWFHPCF